MPTSFPPADAVDGHVLADPPEPPRVIDHLDGFANALTGIGDPSRDKALGGTPFGVSFLVRLLSRPQCEDRWRGSDLGGRIVETVPDEMLREGWEIQVQPTTDDERPRFGGDDAGQAIVEALETKLRDLGTATCLRDALCFERAYGGGAVLLGVDDGEEDLTRPLDESRIRSIRHLTAFSGGWDGELIAWRYYSDPRQARFGEPEVYMLRNLGVPIASPAAPGERGVLRPIGTPELMFYVHESRLLVFPGQAVSYRLRAQMRGWGDSVFTRVDEVLSQYNQTWGGLANLMTDWAQGVLQMDGLADMLANNDPSSDGVVAKRMLGIQMSRSIARTMLLDKTEEFKREVTSLAGVADVVQQFALRLAAAADMPVTLLMGQAPAGLNATGASDIRFFYDRIAARQRSRLVPQLHRLVRLLMLAKDGPTKGAEPERWSIEMRPLWQPTEVEEATVRNKQAMTDQVYIQNGVVTPEEIAASRFGGSKYSTDTVLDLDEREKMAALPLKPAAEPDAPVATSPPAAPAA